MNEIIMWLALSSTPIADPPPVRPSTFFCGLINFYADRYGEAAAEQWAREHKWSEKRILDAKKCRLKTS